MIVGQAKIEALKSLNPAQKMRLREVLLKDIEEAHLFLEQTDSERTRGKIEYIRQLIKYLE